MKIDLRFRDNAIEVTAKICLDKYSDKEFEFILNKDLHIEEILCNSQDTTWKVLEEVQLPFRALSQRVKLIHEVPIKEILIKYAGVPSGWHNQVADEVKSVNWYGTWYPQEASCDVGLDEVSIHGCEAYEVVKGVYNPTTKLWQYGGQGYDPYNILVYKKESLKKVSNDYLNIYTVDPELAKRTQVVVETYVDILDYFNGELFEKIEISKLDIICVAPALTQQGAYLRQDLIVCDKIMDDMDAIISLLGHETAHKWCTGADCGTWEDWLNEGTAEWGHILYVIHAKGEEAFNKGYALRLEEFLHLEGVKTSDGSRPQDVHVRSAILLYKVYKAYGLEVVKKIVQIFTRLEKKTTRQLLVTIENQISPEVKNYLEQHIEIK